MVSSVAGFVEEKTFSWKDGIIGLVLAFVVSAVATLIAFFIVDAAGLIPNSVTIERFNGDESHIVASDVFGSVLFDWVIAGIILLLLRAFTSRPLKIFLIVAAVALVLSLLQPAFLIEDVPARMVVGLGILHIVAGVTGVAALYRYLTSRP